MKIISQPTKNESISLRIMFQAHRRGMEQLVQGYYALQLMGVEVGTVLERRQVNEKSREFGCGIGPKIWRRILSHEIFAPVLEKPPLGRSVWRYRMPSEREFIRALGIRGKQMTRGDWMYVRNFDLGELGSMKTLRIACLWRLIEYRPGRHYVGDLAKKFAVSYRTVWNDLREIRGMEITANYVHSEIGRVGECPPGNDAGGVHWFLEVRRGAAKIWRRLCRRLVDAYLASGWRVFLTRRTASSYEIVDEPG